jgi:pimeloyl-ACP methyl ester carboxylesterase
MSTGERSRTGGPGVGRIDEVLAMPTLLLDGGADVRAPLPVAEAIQDAVPGAEVVVRPGVGHGINLEAPEAFNTEVRHFLRTVIA